MTDRYYRVIAILVNICPDPLRELFLKHAKADPNQTTPYTTLDAYLTFRGTDIKKLKNRKLLRQDQINLIFPQQGQVNIKQWDITLLSLLLKDLFKGQLQQGDEADIDDIRDIRNNLQHISGTAQITDSEFTNIYQRLLSESIRIAFSAKGQNFANKIKGDIETAANSVITDLGDVLRKWYTAEILNIKDELQQLKQQIDSIQNDTSETRKTLKKTTVKRQRSGGKVTKRFKAVDHILEKMRESFKAQLKYSPDDNFQDPPEATRIATQLKNNHLVVVAGFGESPYQKVAFSVIDSLDYDKERCALIACPPDWRHISADDVALVVFLHPFGKKVFDKEKAKQMHTLFDDILLSTSSDNEEDSIDVVIVTDQGILDESNRYYTHDVIENTVVVYKPTTEEDPVDLVADDTRHQHIETDHHYKNLLVQSTAYCKYHRGQFTDDELFQKALDKFKSHKVVVISGPRYSGKTALALKLLSSYQEGHYLILTEPDDLTFIRFGMTCVVVIEDFGGKYEVEKSVVRKWFRKFDMIHAAVKDGKLNVIVTCDFDRLNSAIPATYRHPLLESIVAIPTRGAVKVKEEPTTDEQAQSQGIYRRISFSSARSDTKELLVPSVVDNNLFHASDLSQSRDGSFLFVASGMFSTEFFHFSSDLEYIMSHIVNKDIKHVNIVYCTDAGVVLTTGETEVKLYRLSDESCTLKQSIDLQKSISSVYSNINEIYVICVNEMFVLNEKLEKCRTILHLPFYDGEGFSLLKTVFLREILFFIDENKDIILIEDTKVKKIKYLRKEGFRPQCLCAANDNSVFVFGRQSDNDSRILQVDTKVNVLSDITITNKKYSWVNNMIFDRANARLITYHCGKFEFIYLK